MLNFRKIKFMEIAPENVRKFSGKIGKSENSKTIRFLHFCTINLKVFWQFRLIFKIKNFYFQN